MTQPIKSAYISIEGLDQSIPVTAYVNSFNDNPIIGKAPYKPNNQGKVTLEGSPLGLEPILVHLKERTKPFYVLAITDESNFTSIFIEGSITHYEVEHNGYNLLIHLTTEITQQQFQKFEVSLTDFLGTRTCYTSFLIKDFPKEYGNNIYDFFENHLPDLKVTTTLGVIEAYGHLELNETLDLDPTVSKFPYMSGGESSVLLEVTPLDGGGTQTFFHKTSREAERVSRAYEDLIVYSKAKAKDLIYKCLREKYKNTYDYLNIHLPPAPKGIYIATTTI